MEEHLRGIDGGTVEEVGFCCVNSVEVVFVRTFLSAYQYTSFKSFSLKIFIIYFTPFHTPYPRTNHAHFVVHFILCSERIIKSENDELVLKNIGICPSLGDVTVVTIPDQVKFVSLVPGRPCQHHRRCGPYVERSLS